MDSLLHLQLGYLQLKQAINPLRNHLEVALLLDDKQVWHIIGFDWTKIFQPIVGIAEGEAIANHVNFELNFLEFERSLNTLVGHGEEFIKSSLFDI